MPPSARSTMMSAPALRKRLLVSELLKRSAAPPRGWRLGGYVATPQGRHVARTRGAYRAYERRGGVREPSGRPVRGRVFERRAVTYSLRYRFES